MKLAPKRILSDKQFTPHGDYELVAEMSDLPDLEPERLFDDACDVGIHIRHSLTGTVQTFVLDEAGIRGPENELRGYEFRPLNSASLFMSADIPQFKVTLFND